MNETGQLLTGLESAPLNRRAFLVSTGLCVAGRALFPPGTAQASPVLDAVGKFANAVGAIVVDKNINHYVTRKFIPKQTALEVVKVNSMAGQSPAGRFADLLQAKVYVPKMENTYFFYPVKNVNGFDVLTLFFDRRRKREQFICSLGGPTLFGVSALSATVSRKQSRAVIRRTFLPREGLKASSGVMNRSYDRPDIYRTEAGALVATYRTDGAGRGTVTVEAKDKKGTLLAGGDYELIYRMAY